MTQDSFFTFNVPRYGDLLMDTYLVVNLPNIWSPILQPMIVPDIGDKNGVYRCNCKNAQGVQVNLNPDPEYSQWRPY